MAGNSAESLLYAGPSMYPTFKEGDLLRIEPLNGKKAFPGDVVVFFSSEKDRKVVHRVISMGCDGIRTQGDNNEKSDDCLLDDASLILGRVISVQRGHKTVGVGNGLSGLLYFVAVRILRSLGRCIYSCLHPAYSDLAKSGITRTLLPLQYKIRMVSFRRPAGKEYQLLFGSLVVGRLLPGQGKWWIRRPFKLFIDESSLPGKGS